MTSSAKDLTAEHLAFVASYRAGIHTEVPDVTDELLEALGCVFTEESMGENVQPTSRAQDTATCLPLVLIATSGLHGTELSSACLLSGIVRCPCLEECLMTTDGSYAVTMALINYLRFYSTTSTVDRMLLPDICAILNSWVRPEDPSTALPSIYYLCEKLFGGVWCSLALPENAKLPSSILNEINGACIDAIYQQRPPFLPGLCPAQQESMSVLLPDLPEMAL